MKARLTVTLKSGVLDPQGKAIEGALRSLGIAGWVRNERDGSVAAVFEGERERVESIVDWCRRGPAGARVDEVEVRWEEPAGEHGFLVR